MVMDEIEEMREFEGWMGSYGRERKREIMMRGRNGGMVRNEVRRVMGGRYKEMYMEWVRYKEFVEFDEV